MTVSDKTKAATQMYITLISNLLEGTPRLVVIGVAVSLISKVLAMLPPGANRDELRQKIDEGIDLCLKAFDEEMAKEKPNA